MSSDSLKVTTKTMAKNILIFLHDTLLYGATQSLLSILESLSPNKFFNFLIIIPSLGPIETKLKDLDIDYEIINFPKCAIKKKSLNIRSILTFLNYYRRKLKIIPYLIKLTNNFNPDLIYTNTSTVSIGYDLAKIINVTHVWHIREFGDYFRYIPGKWFIKRKIKNSSLSIFTSKALHTYWGNALQHNFRIVYNGVKSGLNFYQMINDPGEKIKFGLVGAISPIKGQEVAIMSFAQFSRFNKNSELHFYGDSGDKSYYNHLRNLVNDLDCHDNINFHPFSEDIDSVYKKITVLLNCSEREGFGRTTIEAMIRGIPVISNASGGSLEIIDDGVNGLLYNKTHESLLQKMLLLTSSPSLYQELSKNAIIKARKKFSIDNYVNEMKGIFKTAH